VLSLDDLAFAKKALVVFVLSTCSESVSQWVDLQSDLDLAGAIVGALLSGSGPGSGRVLGVLRYSVCSMSELGGRVAMPHVSVSSLFVPYHQRLG